VARRRAIGLSAPPVSWKAIERDARVVAADGSDVGKVAEVVGDPEADIFNGLVVSPGRLQAHRYLPAERVTGIWPDRVEVAATAEEIEALPPYEQPVAERWSTPDDFMTRLRRLFGFYGKRR
jgi:sporulation protein YlmC with PRC-barrel domain